MLMASYLEKNDAEYKDSKKFRNRHDDVIEIEYNK